MVTEVSNIGFFDRIKSAFIGVFVGIILFFGSFIVLYVNEGVQKFAEVIARATVLTDGEIVSKDVITQTGVAAADAPVLGDDTYIIGGSFLALQRETEVFAWQEIASTRTEEHVGGSQTQTTTYTYEKRWVDVVSDTQNFKEPQGHENMRKTINSRIFFADGVRIGSYPLQVSSSLRIHDYEPLNFSEVIVQQGEVTDDGKYLFITRNGTTEASDPVIGDERIGYSVIRTDGTMTFVGALRDGKLQRRDRPTAFDLFAGDRETAYRAAQSEDSFRIWMFRLLGFGMMAIGLFLLVNPFIVFLSVIPFFGTVGKFVTLFASVSIALVMSTITIIISIVAHNIIALLLVMVATIIASIYFFGSKKKVRNSSV